MLVENGQELLQQYAERSFRDHEVLKVTDRVYYFMGFGHSNATLVIGDNSCILIDTLDTDARCTRLVETIQTITDKPIKTLIYTHGHPDHTGDRKSVV